MLALVSYRKNSVSGSFILGQAWRCFGRFGFSVKPPEKDYEKCQSKFSKIRVRLQRAHLTTLVFAVCRRSLSSIRCDRAPAVIYRSLVNRADISLYLPILVSFFGFAPRAFFLVSPIADPVSAPLACKAGNVRARWGD